MGTEPTSSRDLGSEIRQCFQKGQLKNGIARALEWLEQFPDAQEYQALVDLCLKQAFFDETIQCLQAAFKQYPLPHFALQLGDLYRHQGQLKKAIWAYSQGVIHQPDSFALTQNLAQTHLLNEEPQQTHQVYLNLSRRFPQESCLRLQAAQWKYPKAVLQSAQEGGEWFEKALEGLADFEHHSLELAPVLDRLNTMALHPPLQIRYYGQPQLYQSFKATYAQKFRVDMGGIQGTGGGLGIFIAPGHEASFIRAMSALSLQNPQLILLGLPSSVVLLQRAFPASTCQALPVSFSEILVFIRAQCFDTLYLWEVGTHAWNYFIGFYRLAKRQVTSVGMPESTALPCIDAFIVPPHFAGTHHFSEECLFSPYVPLYLEHPTFPQSTRRELGLPEEALIYLCPHTLLKIHPDMDRVFSTLLDAQPLAHIYFFEHHSKAITAALKRRLQKSMSLERIHFLPRLSYSDYLSVMACSDLVLDAFPVNGGLTTFDALFTQTPFVSLRGESLSQGLSGLISQDQGLKAGIAESIQGYLEWALEPLSLKAQYLKELSKSTRLTPVLDETAAFVKMFLS